MSKESNWYTYKIYLSIGFVNCDIEEYVDLRDYSLSESEFFKLNKKEKDKYIENIMSDIMDDLITNYVDCGYEKVD